MLRVGSFFAWIDRQDVRRQDHTDHSCRNPPRPPSSQTRVAVAASGAGERLPTALPELGPETPAHGVTVAAKARIQLFSVTGIKYLFYCACAHIFHLGRCRS
jgi:hypothetical protein